MPVYEFVVSMDGIDCARESVEAECFDDACAVLDARKPAPRWFALHRPTRIGAPRRLADIDEYARYKADPNLDPRD